MVGTFFEAIALLFLAEAVALADMAARVTLDLPEFPGGSGPVLAGCVVAWP
jgi:hypothetical protein